MRNRNLRRTLSIAAGCLLIALIGGVVTSTLASPSAQIVSNNVYLPLVLSERILSETIGKVYLPLVNNRAPFVTNFGVQADVPDVNPRVLAPLNVEWLRLNGPDWSDVQPTEGAAYDWNAESARKFRRGLETLQRRNISPRVIMLLNSSPLWATVGEHVCGQIRPEYYDEYAAFVRAVAVEFPTVDYIELGNEPDVDPDKVPENSEFGCWGDAKDEQGNDVEFYNGRAYGEMLKVVYPVVKPVRPSIQVLNGGLLLDKPYTPSDEETRTALFIEGVFAAGAGSSFDIMNYHGYYNYTNGFLTPDGRSQVGVGSVDWKVPYLREIMQRYGVAEKPLINSESALLCRVSDLNACHEAQGSMVGRLMARAARDRVTAVIWYLLDSDRFRDTAMVDPNTDQPRPVYDAFKHTRSLLGGAQYVGALENQQEGVEGYRFQNVNLKVTIFWSDQPGKTATIQVPVGSTVRCTDRAGAKIDCQNNNGVVTLPAVSRPTFVTAP